VRGTSETIEIEGSGGIDRDGEGVRVGEGSETGGDEGRGEEEVDGAGGGSDGVAGIVCSTVELAVGPWLEDEEVEVARLDEIPSDAVSSSFAVSIRGRLLAMGVDTAIVDSGSILAALLEDVGTISTTPDVSVEEGESSGLEVARAAAEHRSKQ